MTDALWWTTSDARRAAADPVWPEALLDVPAIVIDLRGDDDYDEPEALFRAPCPVIGITAGDEQTLWPVDLLLTEGSPDVALIRKTVEEAASVLTASATANPTAAATLARLLRLTADLDVAAALEVESLAYSMLLAGPEFREWLVESGSKPLGKADDVDVVLAENRGGVLQVTLNRPHVHNAFNAAMRDALVEALTVALSDYSVGTIELAGNGPSFCSGGDLSEFGTTDDPVHAHLIRTGRSVGAVLHQLQDRLTVRVHGACIGAGVELPAFARRVAAAEGTTFRLPEVGMGLIPGAGGTVSLPRRIGRQRTLLLALSGLDLPVTDALRWGLVDRVDQD